MAQLDLATLVVKIKSDSTQFKQGVDQAKQSSDKFAANLKKNVGTAANAAFAAASAAAVAFVVTSVNEFQAFEQGMSEVFTLLPGISEEAMSQMESQVLDAGTEMGRLSDETVPALYQALSAGVPQDNVFEFLATANAAALGGVTDLETAVDGISSVVNAYGAEMIDATEASDMMFTAVRLGKTDFSQLSASLFQVVPTAASLGLSFENLTAALAVMTAQGVPTSVATTQLRQALVELSKEGTIAADIFERVAGVSFAQFVANGGNLQEALALMADEAANAGVPVSNLFSSVEAGAAALALSGNNADVFTSALNAMEESAGATESAAALMSDTGTQAINELKAAFEALQITIGEQLAPTVTSFAQKATEQLDLMTSTTRLNEMSRRLRDMGFTMGEVNDIIGDGKAQFDLWRTAADMEDDLARNEAGMRRMQYAIEATNLGLENNMTTVSGMGGVYTTGRNQIAEYVEEQERLYQINQQNAQYDEILTRGTYNVRDANVAATDAVDGWITAQYGSLSATENTTDAIEDQTEALTFAQLVAQQHTEQIALLESGEREMTFTTQAAVTAGQMAAQTHLEQAQALDAATASMASYFIGATQATDAVGFFATTTTDTGAVLVDSTVNQEAMNLAMYDAAAAAGASAVELAVLGVATGVLSEEQAEAALKTAILQAGVAELAAAYVAGDLSISGLRTRMGELVADINNMDVEIGTSTGEVDIYAGSLTNAGTAALTAAEHIGGLKTAAEDAAGDYSIHFDITTTGSIPDATGDGGAVRGGIQDPGENAAGTDFWGGGWTWVGEDGPELLNLPTGSEVVNNEESMAMMGGSTKIYNIDARGSNLTERQIKQLFVEAMKEVGEEADYVKRTRG